MAEEQKSSVKASEEKEKLNIKELEELKKKLEECQKQKDEYLVGWQRARADFLNYKKEEIERIEEILKYAGVELILRILPILDNFEVAEKKLPENLKVDELRSSPPFADARVNDESIKGLLQIKTQIQDFLKTQEVEEIKTTGEKFDPNFMEAAEMVEMKDKDSGMVIEEIQKGYKINGRLLRPAKVKVVK